MKARWAELAKTYGVKARGKKTNKKKKKAQP